LIAAVTCEDQQAVSDILIRTARASLLVLYTHKQDVQGVEEAQFNIHVNEDVRISGFAGWFTADFRGTRETPLPAPQTLSTGPENGYTHWGQQVFYLEVC
jgi:hypothetical protein